MGIKRLGGDDHWMKIASKCNSTTDYCVTNSAFEEEVFRSTFWQDTPFLRYGHPRNDVLFNKKAQHEAAKKIRKYYQLPDDEKILLYAPTFRDRGNINVFNIDYYQLKKTLENRFGGSWTILIRFHFKNRGAASRLARNMPGIVNATAYDDMQELMLAADAGITDYSSWAYDYLLLKRPLFLYTPDLSDYDQERGFYYGIDTTPFPRSENNEQLVASINSFNDTQYLKDVEAFLEDKGCYETGNAAIQTVNKIEELLGL